MNRIIFLEDFLEKKPNDDFAQYALAMEYAKVDRLSESISCYETLLARNPDYSAGHFQYALLLQRKGDIESAKQRFREGISAATRTKNNHAKKEMMDALEAIEEAEQI